MKVGNKFFLDSLKGYIKQWLPGAILVGSKLTKDPESLSIKKDLVVCINLREIKNGEYSCGIIIAK
jgi:hypothetical protein